MTLVDTSVWVDHFRHRNVKLGQLLMNDEVLAHPFIVGELACGSLSKRDEILALLSALPAIPVAHHPEVLRLLDVHILYGRGLGWVDVHLLASAIMARTSIWTLDKPLARAASAMGVSAE